MKSWLKYTLRTAAILLTATLLTTSCLQSDFDEPLLAGDTVKVSFNPTLDNNETTRVGEGKSVDKLYAELYLKGDLIGERHVYEVSNGNISGFSMELLKNQTYTIVFWAQNESCGAYDTSDLSKIQINYPENIDFSDIENSDIEKYDAFYAKCDVIVNADTIREGVNIQLTRPFALVVAGTNEQVETNTTSSLTFSSIATQFDAFTGKASEGAEKTISFEPNNSTKVPGKEQVVMLGIAYVLPMPNLENTTVTVTTTLDGQSKDTGINIPNLTANKRYNLLGSDLVVDAGWGGNNYLSLPDVADDGWIHITEAEQLATLLRDGYDNSDSENQINGIHLCASFNMGGKEIIPTATATFKNVIIDGAAYSVNSTYNLDTPIEGNPITEGGGIYELKGLNISGKGVFNSTDTFTARYIKFTNVTVNSAAEAGGVVGTATGSLTLTNITVSGEVTGKNKVGGLVGYISNSKDNEATISNCHSTATITINNESDNTNHEIFVGGLVGCFSGNTKDEVLTFEGGCSANATGYFTPFCSAEQACFNSDCTVIENLLGGEENCRGSVYYGESRFFYRWDGVRKVKPLIENSYTSIYSPYDLAYLQDRSDNFSKNIWFGNHIDLGNRVFTPIKTNTNIDGNSKVLYNLKVDTYQDENISGGGGLIRTISNGRSENLEFRGADIRILHVAEADGGTTGNAYCGTLAATVGANHTISNVDCYDGQIYAVCKTGGLVGRISYGTFNCSDCEVDSYTITNYVVPEDVFYEKFSNSVYIGDKTFSKKLSSYITITAYLKNVNAAAEASFNPEGEVGGLIGFVGATSNINNCHTKNITIDATGQPDNKSGVKVTGKWGLSPSARNNLNATAAYTIAGRHVNKFIGDAKAEGTSTKITINNCTATNATYVREQNNHSYSGGTCDIVGCAYYIGGVATLDLSPNTEYPFGADKGSVKVNGTEILDKAKAVIKVADILF